MSELQQWTMRQLDAFFQKVERPEWSASWQLALAAEDQEQAQHIWAELTLTSWKVLQSYTLDGDLSRKDLALARLVYEAQQQGIQLFRAGEMVFPDRASFPELAIQTLLSTRTAGESVKWYISWELGSALLVIWSSVAGGPYRRTLVLSSLPGQLWRWDAYRDVERDGIPPLPPNCLARYYGRKVVLA